MDRSRCNRAHFVSAFVFGKRKEMIRSIIAIRANERTNERTKTPGESDKYRPAGSSPITSRKASRRFGFRNSECQSSQSNSQGQEGRSSGEIADQRTPNDGAQGGKGQRRTAPLIARRRSK